MQGPLAGSGYQIVAGHHRVAACRALGWTEVDAIVVTAASHLNAELLEIDENLCRSELTASQRAQAIKRRRRFGRRCIRRRKRKFWVGKLRPPRKPLNAKTAPKTSRSLPQRPPPSPVKPSAPSTSTWPAPKPLATTCPELPAPAWTRAWSWTSEVTSLPPLVEVKVQRKLLA